MPIKERMILEAKISSLLKSEDKSIYFEYTWEESSNLPNVGSLANINFEVKQFAVVTAYTVNLKMAETFLLKRVVDKDHLSALQSIYEYVASNKETMNSFTVMWSKKEKGVLGSTNKSYFYCHDIKEVIEKFFTNKSVKDYVIYEIKLNPIS